MQVEAVTHKLVVFEQIDIEAEGEEEFVLLKQRATYVDVKRVRKMVLQNLESKYTEKALWQKSVQHFENGLEKKKKCMSDVMYIKHNTQKNFKMLLDHTCF